MFPLAALTPLIELLRSCVRGVMLPLGDRVRRAPSLWRPEHRRIPEPLAALIQAWLQKRRQMIEALVHRINDGTHRPRPYKPRAAQPDAIRKPRVETPPEKRLPPRGRGWITRMASEINGWANGLSQLIDMPEMKAMILVSPQLARLWAPLLHALNQTRPEWWPKPPPRPKRPRQAGPRPKRPRGPKTSAIDMSDPVAAWLSRFPPKPPPPPPPLPPGMEISAPSIPTVPLPWHQERLWPPAPPTPARRQPGEEGWDARLLQILRRREAAW